jgi:hypothetical protein
MSDQDKQPTRSLASAGSHGLTPLGGTNPLVSRGLDDIARWSAAFAQQVTVALPVHLSISIKGELSVQPCGSRIFRPRVRHRSQAFLAKTPGIVEISTETLAAARDQVMIKLRQQYETLCDLNAPELILENQRRRIAQFTEPWNQSGEMLRDYWFRFDVAEIITNKLAEDLLRLNDTLRLNGLSLHISRDAEATFLRRLQGISDLSLVLDRRCSVDNDLLSLQELPDLESLSLSMDGSDVTDQGLVHIRNLPQTWRLSINECGAITDEGLSHLSSLNELRTLEAAGCLFPRKGLAHLSVLTSLEKLDLNGCELDDASLTHLLPLTELRELRISRFNRYTIAMETRHSFDSRQAHDFKDPAVHQMARRNLLSLMGMSGGITDDGIVHLSGFSALETLELAGHPIAGAGLGHLSNLYLTSLDLNECEMLTDQGAVHLAALTELRSLYLSKSQITDAGLAHLTSLSLLKELGLSDCTRITDRGMRSIAALSDLDGLFLSGTRITDEGLSSLSCLRNLSYLALPRSGRVTQAGVDTLQRALPDCEISF